MSSNEKTIKSTLVVDTAAPNIVYVGADIGIWRSPDRGMT
jgi:hypothetical protein